MNKFKAGQTYQTFFIGDYGAKINIVIVKRTAKTVSFTTDTQVLGGVQRRKIEIYDGNESFHAMKGTVKMVAV